MAPNFRTRWHYRLPFAGRNTSESELRNLWRSAVKTRETSALHHIEPTRDFPPDSWFDSLALQTQVVKKKSAPNWSHGKILYATLSARLADLEIRGPVWVLETGTARGFSAICMARAVADSGHSGHVISIDALPVNKEIYWNSISDFEGKFTRRRLLSEWPNELELIVFLQGRLPGVLDSVDMGRIHFAFLDSQHSESAVWQEFRFVSERQDVGDVIVFDDVTPRSFPGVVSALKKIESLKSYKVEYLGSDSRGYAIAKKIVGRGI